MAKITIKVRDAGAEIEQRGNIAMKVVGVNGHYRWLVYEVSSGYVYESKDGYKSQKRCRNSAWKAMDYYAGLRGLSE